MSSHVFGTSRGGSLSTTPRAKAVTLDGRRSAHFEHTIAVTEHGPEVLTLPR
jgi:methionine aminopeptidase